MVTSGFLDKSFDAVLPTLRIHNLHSPLYQGEPYRLLTSTDVVPGMGLGAAARVDWRVREEVYRALAALNASHPLCVGADIAGFTAHSSSELPRTVAHKASGRSESYGSLVHPV